MTNSTIKIASILTPERTQTKVECRSKKRALEMLADFIAENTSGINAEELFLQLVAREKLGSTGIGSGIAIPHCRFNTNGATIGALMTLSNPVDFDAIDGAPVDIVFAMLVPENAESEHLKTLASLAEALQQQNYVKSLRRASDPDQLFHLAVQEAC